LLGPTGQGIVVWTLGFGDEVRPKSEYFTGVDKMSDAKSVSAVEAVIKKGLKDWSPNMVSDPIEDSL
jgi:DNA end-binding protein Ku